MTKFLFFLYCLMAGAVGQSQNVSIGTNAPTQRLQVSGGNIKLTGDGYILSYDGYHRIWFHASENIIELQEYGNFIFSAAALPASRPAA